MQTKTNVDNAKEMDDGAGMAAAEKLNKFSALKEVVPRVKTAIERAVSLFQSFGEANLNFFKDEGIRNTRYREEIERSLQGTRRDRKYFKFWQAGK